MKKEEGLAAEMTAYTEPYTSLNKLYLSDGSE